LVGVNNPYLKGRNFKTVFIDESSQALEPAAWIPMLRCERAIMAGDHLQLAPTVKSAEAKKQGLGDTIFERCMHAYNIDVMLTDQYRMHPDIMAFSNAEFYQGRLKTAKTVLARNQVFDRPTQFIDTAGCGFQEAINPETLSTFNQEEALFVLRRLDEIIGQLTNPQDYSYGIIAPYKAQIEVLRIGLRELDLPEGVRELISINTVDAFQGQERDVILISLTRSNDRGEIGFLAEEKRMNVAMTRARFKLLIVGDSATLSSNGFFDRMIKYYQEKEWYNSAFEYLS
jgi:superfamily I DNA and/or RNA helicase